MRRIRGKEPGKGSGGKAVRGGKLGGLALSSVGMRGQCFGRVPSDYGGDEVTVSLMIGRKFRE